MLWIILVQFICRLTLGLAGAMFITSPRLVTSGYYRVHLWVLMGCNTLAALFLIAHRSDEKVTWGLVGTVVAAAVFSYLGSVCWLYEKKLPGRVLLLMVALAGLVSAQWTDTLTTGGNWWDGLALADTISSSCLIGATLAAMFLGHWYLNTPTMQLAPLKKLVMLILVAVAVRALVSGGGLIAELGRRDALGSGFLAAVSLRWLAGIVGTAVLAVMTWITLKIPNTQSATGILYVGVIFVFLGELTSQLLHPTAAFPL